MELPFFRRSGRASRTVRYAISLLVLALGTPGRTQPNVAPPAAVQAFRPTPNTDLRLLMALVAARSPDIQSQALAVDVAASDVRQAHLWDNPVVDFSVGTLPIGTANPPDLPSPLTNIPNYNVGVGLHPDLFRRGPRVQRARALLSAEQARLSQSTRDRALGLARILGIVATASLRRDANRGLAEEARALLKVARERVSVGFGAPVDSDRAEIDLLRLEQQVLGDESLIRSKLSDCTALIGLVCDPFASSEFARGFLDHFIRSTIEYSGLPAQSLQLEQRPDLQALQASSHAAQAEAHLASASALPDPTVHVGYTYDNFVASGNQRNSMNVSLNMPLPLFDHGQAQAQAARARAMRSSNERQLRLEAAQARIESLRQVLAMQARRQQALQETVLPRAREVLVSVNKAYESRAIRITDLIQARRSLYELGVSEADSLADLFDSTLDLLTELPVSFDAGTGSSR